MHHQLLYARRVLRYLGYAVIGMSVAAVAQAQRPAATAHTPQPPSKMSRDASQAALRARTKITEDSARKVALAVVHHGTVQSSELEREHGHLIYSFDIKIAGKSGVDEVNVNAITGAVIAHTHETPAAEKREARQEARGRHKL